MHKVRFIFLAGTPRSGGNITLALLDGHPDILTWPYDFQYFPFFSSVAGGHTNAPVKKLNSELIERSFKGAFIRRMNNYKGLDKLKDKYDQINLEVFNFGGFDIDLFQDNLHAKEDAYMDSTEYLHFLFECLHNSTQQYKDKTFKYYAMLTTCRGFDWDNDELIQNSLFLYNYRNDQEGYGSLRDKYLKMMGASCFFKPSGKKSALYWFENYRRMSQRAQQRMMEENFFIVPVSKLQQNTEELLHEICSFLHIKPHSCIQQMTILGIPYQGNAHERELNNGKIVKRTSRRLYPLSTLEKRIFENLGLFDFENGRKVNGSHLSFFEALKLVFMGAFKEISPLTVNGKNSGLPHVRRILLFFRLWRTVLLLKDNFRVMKTIAKGNPHLRDMSL